jgi:hypothetical protein
MVVPTATVMPVQKAAWSEASWFLIMCSNAFRDKFSIAANGM